MPRSSVFVKLSPSLPEAGKSGPEAAAETPGVTPADADALPAVAKPCVACAPQLGLTPTFDGAGAAFTDSATGGFPCLLSDSVGSDGLELSPDGVSEWPAAPFATTPLAAEFVE